MVHQHCLRTPMGDTGSRRIAGSVDAADSEHRRNAVSALPAQDVVQATLLRVANVAKAFGPTQAVRDALLRAARRRGARARRRERLRQVDDGEDPERRPRARLRARSSSPARPSRRSGRRATPSVAASCTVFQEVLVAESCSVLDNVWLGADDPWRTRVGKRDKSARAKQTLGELLGREVDLDDAGRGSLALATDRRARSCARSCASRRSSSSTRRPRRSTSPPATGCSRSCGDLSRRGVGVIFITHRMDEIEQIGDRITVMRSGETVAELERGRLDARELVHLMTGSEALGERGARPAATRSPTGGATRCSASAGSGCAPTAARSTSRSRRESSSASRASRGTAATTFLEALRGGIATEGEVVRHVDGRRSSSATRPTRPTTTSPTCPRERRLDSAVQLDVDPRELRAGDVGPGPPVRPAQPALVAASASLVRRSARDRARARRRMRSRRCPAATSRR